MTETPTETPTVKPGLRFLHNKWLDGQMSYADLADKSIPAREKAQRMEVTALRNGSVYFAWLDRNGNRLRPSHFISLDRFPTIVLEYLPEKS